MSNRNWWRPSWSKCFAILYVWLNVQGKPLRPFHCMQLLSLFTSRSSPQLSFLLCSLIGWFSLIVYVWRMSSSFLLCSLIGWFSLIVYVWRMSSSFLLCSLIGWFSLIVYVWRMSSSFLLCSLIGWFSLIVYVWRMSSSWLTQNITGEPGWTINQGKFNFNTTFQAHFGGLHQPVGLNTSTLVWVKS